MKCSRIKNRFLRVFLFALVSPLYMWGCLDIYFDKEEFVRFCKEVWSQ